VTVGDAGSVQGVQGTLKIENPASFTQINVDDSADAEARQATLSSMTPQTAWIALAGLAPAGIRYRYRDIDNVALTLNSMTTLNPIDTGSVPTYVNGQRLA